MEARQIHIRDGKKEYYLSVDDILFAITSEGSGNYCDIYLIQHTLYKTIRIQLGQLWKLIEDLKPTNCHTLARIGRSHIVNLKYLQLADPKKRTITLHTDKDVVLNKVPLAAVKSLLMLLSIDKRRKVLSVYSQRMKLMVPVENLNEEHLTIDGREYIDLGLPSGRLWATQNLYAKDVEDCGHQTFIGWEDATTIVEDESWRLPTAVEFHELFDESLKTWCTTSNGEKGVLLTGPNGNRVFLIAGGCKRKDAITRDHGILSGYWTATAISESQAIAMEMSEYEETNNFSDGVNLIEGYEDILDGYQKHIGISKSRYTLFRQCPKALWLKSYQPELIVISDALQQRFQSGSAVGDLAMGLFGEFNDVTSYTSDGRLNLGKMAEDTRKWLDAGVEVICEASFFYDGGYCAVDILKKENGGYVIYEVKSSTDGDKEVYAQDVAYQKYILVNNGINVTGTYLVCINSAYVLEGELDIHRLFQVQDISEAVSQEYPLVASQVASVKKMLSKMDEEPDMGLDVHCHKPYDCAFWQYCSRHIPKQSVFNLYRMYFDKKIAHYQQGVITYEQLQNEELNEKQRMQVECSLNDTIYINKVEIARFLDTLTYPLYFLDFETMQPVIPEFQGTHPYQQIPFQYSLHYIEEIDGKLKHKEFLGISGQDPRRALAEQICKDIPMNVCVTAYNKAFECTRLRELAETFPDLSEHLLNIRDHIIDLLVPFQSGWYYVPAMGGSFSIKSVLPALFPDDPELDYHNLQGSVHNGAEAMNIFPKIKDMSAEEQQAARRSLLKYCDLDTYAMVKVWQKLKKVSR